MDLKLSVCTKEREGSREAVGSAVSAVRKRIHRSKVSSHEGARARGGFPHTTMNMYGTATNTGDVDTPVTKKIDQRSYSNRHATSN